MRRDASERDIRGLALLMRRGMAAWMRSADERCNPAALGEGVSHGAAGAAHSSTVEQLLVHIVAAMAAAHAQEVCA